MAARRVLLLVAFVLCCWLLLNTSPRTDAQNTIPDASLPDGGTQCWDPACYQSVEQVQSFLQSTASTYPQIASLTDVGLSWEGIRRLWMLTLSNTTRSDPRPTLFLVGGMRPRDVSTT